MEMATTESTQEWLPGPRVVSRTQRIFVAEDDLIIREAIVDALAEDGHEVFGVGDGAELLECIDIVSRGSLRGPDLIAMDVFMPRMSGLDVLECLRASGEMIPVVLITGFATSELYARAAIAGSTLVLQKPFDLRELRRAALPTAPWRR